MREIKFRGRTAADGKWIYGDLVHYAFDGISRNVPVGIKALSFYPVEVLPETVGQFTGLLDKNGKEFYEGDVIKTHFNKTDQYDEYNEFGEICFQNLSIIIEDKKHGKNNKFYSHSEVIGNIHENPELFKGDKP